MSEEQDSDVDVGAVTIDSPENLAPCPRCRKDPGREPPGEMLLPGPCVACGGSGRVSPAYAEHYRGRAPESSTPSPPADTEPAPGEDEPMTPCDACNATGYGVGADGFCVVCKGLGGLPP